jgi:hypothetical protein
VPLEELDLLLVFVAVSQPLVETAAVKPLQTLLAQLPRVAALQDQFLEMVDPLVDTRLQIFIPLQLVAVVGCLVEILETLNTLMLQQAVVLLR